jgi:hypothetical protein
MVEERILREIRRRTRVVGAFPDGQSALNLAAARLRHIAGTTWSTKRYLNIELLKEKQIRGAITAQASAGHRHVAVGRFFDRDNLRPPGQGAV